MLTKVLFIAVSLTIGSAAVAQDAAAAASPTITASAARKAYSISFAHGGRKDVFAVDAGPNDSVAAIEIVEGNRAVKVPGSTVSAGDKPHTLKSSLTYAQATAGS